MAYNTEEEQLEALKDWWRENGRSIITGVVIGLGALAGWQGWNWYNDTRASQAAALYEPVLQAEQQDRETIEAVAAELRDGYARTGYAALAALAAARAAVEEGDLDAAAGWLRWVGDDARDAGLRHVARARLARILAERGDTGAALELVQAEVPDGFIGLYAEIEGDLLLQAGDAAGAVSAYERALAAAGAVSNRQLVQMKLNRAMGETGSVAAADASSDGNEE